MRYDLYIEFWPITANAIDIFVVQDSIEKAVKKATTRESDGSGGGMNFRDISYFKLTSIQRQRVIALFRNIDWIGYRVEISFTKSR